LIKGADFAQVGAIGVNEETPGRRSPQRNGRR
jgi:hypothetical protein